jgi:hypothetical protein
MHNQIFFDSHSLLFFYFLALITIHQIESWTCFTAVWLVKIKKKCQPFIKAWNPQVLICLSLLKYFSFRYLSLLNAYLLDILFLQMLQEGNLWTLIPFGYDSIFLLFDLHVLYSYSFLIFWFGSGFDHHTYEIEIWHCFLQCNVFWNNNILSSTEPQVYFATMLGVVNYFQFYSYCLVDLLLCSTSGFFIWILTAFSLFVLFLWMHAFALNL